MAAILLIEDNERNIKLFSDILEFYGYEVKVATSGAEGYKAAQDEKLDLILLDIQLPDMDGLEVARMIRSTPGIADVPIVAATSYAMEEDRDRAIEVGCNDYITKPVDVGLLLETIKKHLK